MSSTFVTVPDPALPEVRRVTPKRFGDHRGFFVETWNAKTFAEAGFADVFVQDNHSRSEKTGTVRGLHFQAPPFAQAKLVRCTVGRVFDVAVDVRRRSPTFGRHVGVELSAANGHQLYVPVGFAHGFVTLEPGTEVQYKVTADYSPSHDLGIAWNDPALGIPWPVAADAAVLSDKDRRLPRLADIVAPFV